MLKLLLASTFIPAMLFSQSRKERKALEAQQKADQVVIADLRNHIQHLSGSANSSQNNGSNTANPVEYISAQFKSAGLIPKGTAGYIQPFTIDEGKKIDSPTFLKVNDALLQVNKEFFPLAFSAEKKVEGMPAMALREKGVPWFVDVKDWLDDGIKNGASIEDVIKKEASRLAVKGASAVFIYNSGSATDGISFDKDDKSSPLPIPVIYITNSGYKKYFSDHSQILDIELGVAFAREVIVGKNAVGFMDNAAASTVVIGAHYNSSFTDLAGKEKVAGADDNASGAAMLIELAKMLSTSKNKANNFLFVALGGPRNGTNAADYLLANYPVTTPVNYMLNLDMVGSYNDSKKVMVQGYNSSSLWKDIFTQVSDKNQIFSIDTTNVIADAHSPFYNKEIPVLSFSSANHNDYANTSDDESKINYSGELQITKMVYRLIEASDTKGKIAFSKVAHPTTTTAPVASPETTPTTTAVTQKASVSLGVIPDKTSAESGLKIIGVTPKKLASRIGLQPGDVLTYLGSYKISDFKTYMQALANFKIGDKTLLKIKRGKDDKEFALEF